MNKFFTAILWNTSAHLEDKILKDIPNVEQVAEVSIAKDNLKKCIYEIYKLDKRCAHDIVLPPKIERLSKDKEKHLFIKFYIENPIFDENGVCTQATELKEKIRYKYLPEIDNYIRDIIIHIADNHEHAEYIWENFVTNLLYVRALKGIFDKIENYVVLRGYDDFHKRVPELPKGEDIDLLLEDKDDIVDAIGANIINVSQKTIKFDRRYVGDGYYDENWQKDMLKTKSRHQFFYILDDVNRYFATLYHSLIHKGSIHEKYKKMYVELEKKLGIKIENENTLQRYYHLVRFMIENGYGFTHALDAGVGFFRNRYKLNLFILRKVAIKKQIIDHVLSEIEKKNYKIIDTILVNINNNKKFCKNFYNNYSDFEKEILQDNDNQCLAIITDFPEGSQPNVFKNEIRAQYIDFYPNPGGSPGNIIHASDSSEACERELALLLNEDKIDFKNIGTYYDTKDE